MEVFLNFRKFNMWRFLRLVGIKSNVCPANQVHFRIIGTTCANADCDADDINCPCDDKGFKPSKNKENFATVASKQFHKRLQTQVNNEFKYREKRKDAYKSFGAFKNPILREISNKPHENLKKNNKNNNNKTHTRNSNVNKIAEKDLDLSVKENEDIEDIVFGSLSEKTRETEFLPDEVDDKTILLPRHLPHTYGRIMLELCKERKLKEALNVLEVEMKQREVIPDNYCYNILINACGKMGYAEKAFELYYQMKRRGLRAEKFAYTGLFNACANSPLKSESLKLARTLRKQVKDNSVLLHPISYHAMIKAFGHCGDIQTAFEIVDEMVYENHPVNSETMDFLLQACLTDKETGFRHALMVWRKMRILRIRPSIYTYNMLLRCVRDCGSGDPQLLSELFDDMLESHKIKGKLKRVRDKEGKNVQRDLPDSSPWIPKLEENVVKEEKTGSTNLVKNVEQKEEKEFYQIGDKNEIVKVKLEPNMELEIVSPEKVNSSKENAVLPNVLSYKVQPGNVIAISSLEKKEDRIWLLGGITGFLNSMREDRVKPNIITFTHILESLPNNLEVEKALLSTMEKLKVKPDIIFCNRLIRKRCIRNCLEEAKDALTLMQKYNIPMDIISYGCLAIGCRKVSDSRQLLRDMKSSSILPNEEIMGSLLTNAVRRQEYAFAIELLQRMKRLNVPVNEILLNLLENTRTTIKKKFIEIESEPPGTELTKREERIRDEMKLFLMEYKHWLKLSKVQLKEHPWAQFGYGEQTTKILRELP